MDKIEISHAFDKNISDLSRRRSDEFNSFIRQILLICSTIIGILISFKEKKPMGTCELFSFMMVVGLFGLCILIGLTLLYGEVRNLDRIRRAVQEQKRLVLSGDKTEATSVFVPTEKFFLIFEKAYYLTFGLAICSIVAYSYIAFS